MPTYTQKDNLLIKTASLVAGTSPYIDTGAVTNIGIRAGYQIQVDAPALTAPQLPAATALTYSLGFTNDTLQDGTTPDWTNEEIVSDTLWKQTGSAAGSPALKFTFDSSHHTQRFVRLKIAATGATAASAAIVEVAIVG